MTLTTSTVQTHLALRLGCRDQSMLFSSVNIGVLSSDEGKATILSLRLIQTLKHTGMTFYGTDTLDHFTILVSDELVLITPYRVNYEVTILQRVMLLGAFSIFLSEKY